ncbi:hypothetical protein [Streptomyces sp. NPDC054962]
MSDEQQPTTPPSQLDAVESMAAEAGFLPGDNPKLAEHNRKMLRRQFGTVDESTPAGRFQVQMLAAITEFEQARRAEIIAAGGDPDEDRDPLETVHAIADDWADTAADADSRAALLDRLTYDLSLSDVRALRLAAEAAATITPRLIRSAKDNSQPVPSIAEDLGVTDSYVYRVLREQRAAQQTPDGRTPWNAYWTLERWESDHWHELTAQSRTNTKDRPDILARYLLAREEPRQDAGTKLRVRVWHFGNSETHAPLAEVTTDDQ